MTRNRTSIALLVIGGALLLLGPQLQRGFHVNPPVPPPSPVASGERQLIAVWESSHPSTGISAYLLSPKLKSYFNSKNHHLWLIDQDSLSQSGQAVPEAFAPWIDRAGNQLPRLFISAVDSSDGGADVLYEGPPPETADGWIDLLKEHGG